MRALSKTRTICSVTYGTEEDIKKLIEYEKKFNLDAVAYILHDKEENEKHYHIIWRFENPRIENCIMEDYKYIGINQNCFPNKCKSIYKAYRYLTHEDEKNKPKYNEDEIKGENIEYIKQLAQESAPKEQREDNTISIINDIIDGISSRNMIAKYGRDYVINYSKYQYMAEKIRYEEDEVIN